MELAVFSETSKIPEVKFNREDEFENEIKLNAKMLFGQKTIYLDIKKRIDTSTLGGSIPDGILFDFEDPEDIRFYLVEVELSKHSFYNHIFPQITKFFAFFKNYSGINILIEKVFSVINEDKEIAQEFRNLSESNEIYKSIKDSIENNPQILLIIDEEKSEFKEIMDTYTDTWDKFVIIEVLKRYQLGPRKIFVMSPDFTRRELLFDIEESQESVEEEIKYSENYHLERVDSSIVSLYNYIKDYMLNTDKLIVFNPQKYYISFRKNRNFAYVDIKKKRIKIAVMLPFEKGREMIRFHKLRQFGEGIQRFYGRPSFEITIENNENLDEVFGLLKEAYRNQEE